MNNITVKGVDNGRVALWDKGIEYDGGEIFIGPNEVKTVPATPAVELALAEKRLERVVAQVEAEKPSSKDTNPKK